MKILKHVHDGEEVWIAQDNHIPPKKWAEASTKEEAINKYFEREK